MKSSLEKLRKIAMNKSEPKENWDQHISVHTDGLTQAAKDMKDMRTCYDGLLSAAAATANSAYEFSESLLEMGSCLLDKTAMHDEGESGGALSLLGKVQLELRKLVDIYRSHIIMTITNPSESLLSELRKVEEMKLQCDEKREMFDYMVGQLKEKGKSRHGKGESFTSQQVQAVREEYDEAARLCVFRVESLKQGQCRSLLTQAARHHAAQLNFFRKGLHSLEAVEPHVKNVAEKQHIDYELCELNDGEVVDDELNSFETNDDGELSFDYRQNKQELDASMSRNSMELDQAGGPTPQISRMKDGEEQINIGKNQGEQILGQQRRAGSHSAPMTAEKFDPAKRIREMRSAVQKLNTHVLPTPADAKSSRTSTYTPVSSTTVPGKSSKNLWHSSPLDIEKHKKFTDDPLPAQNFSKPLVVVEENSEKHFLPLPRPLTEVAAVPQFDTQSGFDTQKIKRQAFSGPLASKPSSNKLHLFTSGPISSTEQPQSISGLLSRVSGGPQPPSSLNVSHNASPPLLPSPKISELHELPRPPDSLVLNPLRSTGAIGHSAPLVNKNREVSPTYRNPLLPSKEGSPLPLPQLSVSRSFSIRSNSQKAMSLHSGKLLESSQNVQNMEEIASPPLTPISLSNIKSPNSGQIRDLVATKVAEVDRLLTIKKKASEISPDLKGTSIFLVGINSSYKSSLGRILADALRYYYFDSDSLVEEAAGGKSAAISYIESDEVGYLASETEVLKQLSSMGRLVVCAGNGAVKSSTNLALLRHGISIWIDVPLDLVAREIMEDRIQLSASDTSTCRSSSEVLAQLTSLYDSGRSGYSTADAIISLQKIASQLGYDELNAVTTEDLCMEVVKEIEKLTRVKKMMEEAARPF